VCLWGIAAGIVAVFAWLLGDVVRQGWPRLSWEFLTSPPSDAGRAGGIAPVVVSTLLILVVCLAAALPLGLATAVYLAEFTAVDRWFGRMVRRSLDVLAGVPSIVFGLFGNAFFCVTLGLGFSILSGGLTLACMVLPIFIRVAEEGIRTVPNDHRLAAAALGMSRTATIRHVILRGAWPGILGGLILGIGRALAETAALIFTSGYSDRLPRSLFDSGRALSIHIYDLSMNVPGGNASASATTLVLVTVILTVNSSAILLGRRLRRGKASSA